MRPPPWPILAVLALGGCASMPFGRTPAAPPPADAAAPARAPAPPADLPSPAAPAGTAAKVVYVPVRCVPRTLPPPPAYPDSDAALRAAGGAADRYQLMAAGRLMREERLAQLEDVVRRCREGRGR